ncbi:hypothetical protein RCH14_001998 [Massilia sp. MP_M2]|uniref:hypothetical protein n=1 Tax=Massilia sp. MP_M2 TaxID=3071713 RepID=UPI00319E09EB
MPEFSPTTPPGSLIANYLHACFARLPNAFWQPTKQLLHALVTAKVRNAPVAPATLARGAAHPSRMRAPENTMNQSRIALRLCARRYMSHCPEG